MQTRSGGALQHPWSALPPRLIPFISAEDKADHLEACTALLPPVVAEEPVAQQGAVAAVAELSALRAAEVPAARPGVRRQEPSVD